MHRARRPRRSMRACFAIPPSPKTQIAFVYAGDIWLVGKEGGSAFRLTSSPGEETFPRFSPDGTRVAYSASYDGNIDVYVIPSTGGEPRRLTHHPMPDRVVGWTPDSKRSAFRFRPRERPPAIQPVLHRRSRGRLARQAAGALRRVRRVLTRWQAVRLHADGAGLPQLEALPRRLVSRSVAVRSRPASRRRTSRRMPPTMRSRCGTAARSTSSRIAARTSATTSGPTTRRAATMKQVTRVRRLRHHLPLDRPGRHRLSGGRTAVLPRRSVRKAARSPGAGVDRRNHAPAADGQGGYAHPECGRLADREACAVRSARRRVHRAGGVRSGRQRQPLVGRCGAVSRAGRPTGRRSPTGATVAASTSCTTRDRRRHWRGEEGDVARRRLPLCAALVA